MATAIGASDPGRAEAAEALREGDSRLESGGAREKYRSDKSMVSKSKSKRPEPERSLWPGGEKSRVSRDASFLAPSISLVLFSPLARMGLVRPKSTFSTPSNPATPDPSRPSFAIAKEARSFDKQFANLYWLRLAVLRKKVAKRAKALWEEMEGAAHNSRSRRGWEASSAREGGWLSPSRGTAPGKSQGGGSTGRSMGYTRERPGATADSMPLPAGVTSPPQHVKRVLDVENGNLCYIIGTVYMDMPLKPNVLEDLAREVRRVPRPTRSHADSSWAQNFIAAPPPRRKFCSESDEVMLEDESGRVRLVGDRMTQGGGVFVTGAASFLFSFRCSFLLRG